MLDLTDIPELVVAALDDGAFAQEQLIGQGEQPATHVLARFGDEVDTVLDEQIFSKRLGDGAPVAEEFAEETAHEVGDGVTAVHVARRQTERQQLAAVIDHQVELEAVESAQRRFAVSGIGTKDHVLGAARIATDGERGGVHKADTHAGAPNWVWR